MAVFAYVARCSRGERQSGTLAAANEQAVLTELRSRDLAPVRVTAVAEKRARRIGVRRLAVMYRQLSDLTVAGVPLLRGLRLLARSKANPALAAVMKDIADHVADGDQLAEAMGRHPQVFPSAHVAMVRAGETGGFLEAVLERLGDFLEQQADLKAKVVGNLAYPVMLLFAGVLVIIGALVWLVPKFETLYARIELPWATRTLLGTSRLLTGSWTWVVPIAAIGLVGGIWAWRHESTLRARMQWQLRVPIIGAITRDLAVGRFTRILGTMLQNGIPMIEAMRISRDAAGNAVLIDAIDEATEAVRAGETLSAPLSQSGLFSDETAEIISVGETAGRLPEVLITVAETTEKRLDRLLSALVRLLEPLLLLTVAGMVVFIFAALVVPMLRMSASIS